MTCYIEKRCKVLLLTFLMITAITCLGLTPTYTSHNLDHTPRIEETSTYFNIDSSPPDHLVRLIFIHHSCGENWLADDNGGLGIALQDNNYFVSDTNYGLGPDSIGDSTDIGQWCLWFRGPDSEAYLNQLYKEGEQHSSYTRLSSNPGGENEVIMFKSCARA